MGDRGRKLFSGVIGIAAFLIMLVPEYSLAAGKKKVDPAELKAQADETVIVVFRKKSMVGAAMTISVGCNEHLKGTLKSSSLCVLKENAGPITVNILQADMPVAQMAVDNRPGETVYLLYTYTKGLFEEITDAVAAPMLKKYKKRPNLPVPKPNPAYETCLINPGLLDDALMKKADALLEPDGEHAVITLVREHNKLTEIPAGIWQNDMFLGSLKGKNFMQIKVAPGKHWFFGKYEQWSVLDAEVEAGKNYTVQVTVTRGWKQAHVRIIPVKSDVTQTQIDTWLRTFENLTWDKANTNAAITQRLQTVSPFIEKVKETVKSGTQETRVLAASDGR